MSVQLCVCLSVFVCFAMATRYTPHKQDPHYQEGRLMALELNHDHILAEAKRAAVETKRLCPRRDPSQTSKRIFVGWGKPRGRQGGWRQASATGHFYRLSASCHPVWSFHLTVPSAKLNPHEEFGAESGSVGTVMYYVTKNSHSPIGNV